MDYQETIELERNIKIKNKAQEIVQGFKKTVKLDLTTKKGNRFTIWADSHNANYVEIEEEEIIFIGDYLSQNMSIPISYSSIFNAIARGDSVVRYVAATAKVQYNEYDYKINKEWKK